MQVLRQGFWQDRSLLYLCRAFDSLEKGDDYTEAKPAYHIGILDFTPFLEHPEFYATNKMMNVKKHYIYNDKFTLNVLDLTQIDMATEEDKAYGIDYWAKLFKAKTWEELKMIAQKNDIFEETGETIFRLNQNDAVRYMCEAREEGQRILKTYETMLKESQQMLKTYETMLASEKKEKEEGERALKTYKTELVKKDAELAEKDTALAEKEALIAQLQAQLKEYRK